jgi:hypothetical protein
MSNHDVVAAESERFDTGLNWVVRVVAVLAVILVAVTLSLAGDPIVHGHPLYWIVLAITLLVSIAAAVRSFWPRRTKSTLRRLGRGLLVVLSISWLAIIGWLIPAGATETGLEAMVTDKSVTVAETSTQISLTPSGDIKPSGVFFQPGAKVDARAYVSTLRPLAVAGHVVVIAKQPLGIGFLATNAFDGARSAFPAVAQWVLGGHSLGGTVAALQAAGNISLGSESASAAPVVGLFLYAAYPAGDMSDMGLAVMSISGQNDGLSTPDAIAASIPNLPRTTTFYEVPGANHASFGEYGIQAGDGVATASRVSTHSDITKATVDFVNARD